MHHVRRKCSRFVTGAKAGMTVPRSWISTLVPGRLRTTDLLDLSGQRHALVTANTVPGSACLRYHHRGEHYVAFPQDTRGFLYLHIPDHAHLAAAEIRFRLAARDSDSPEAAFVRGEDLYVEEEIPWRIPAVMAVQSSAQHVLLAHVLRQDGDLPAVALDTWARRREIRIRPDAALLHKMEQPFIFELGQTSQTMIWVANGLEIHHAKTAPPLRDSRNERRGVTPYSGRVLCCYEGGINRGGNAIMHIRLLRSLSKITLVERVYDDHVPMPRVGELLRGPGGQLAEVNLTKSSAPLFRLLGQNSTVGHISPLWSRLQSGDKLHTKPQRRISHTAPSKLNKTDFIDISGLKQPQVIFSGHPFKFKYGMGTNDTLIPFPPGTHGFLYADYSDVGAGSSCYRFRVTGDWDPSAFATGLDLLRPDGQTWTWSPRHLTRSDFS